jgi:hypothetical protein
MVLALGGYPLSQAGAGRKVTAKALRRTLKKAGLKTTGKKAALTRRVKKAHLKVGGKLEFSVPTGGRRRRGGAGEACATDSSKPDVMDGTVQEDGSCKVVGGRRGRKSRRGGGDY